MKVSTDLILPREQDARLTPYCRGGTEFCQKKRRGGNESFSRVEVVFISLSSLRLLHLPFLLWFPTDEQQFVLSRDRYGKIDISEVHDVLEA